jgi:hypothetical protein
MDDIVNSLQYIIDGGGEDAKVFNTVNLCEDDIEDGGRVFETASASRSLPKEEDKKEAAFEVESFDQESDKEEEEEEEEEEEWEGGNSPHLSNFLSIDTRE